ncbi:MAG: hypothetical protein CME05_07750 [Gemmatimonadaceae bacterium]|nr:hypothetical protein [Gemmatimonadaceae bacterium]|tara:strand:- start:744 stop:1127 length:384 start_codon:yes stop_codon:yes gene_type:complete
MLVDDSAVARHKVGAILCSLKCEVIEAKDGTEALSTLEKETPDLLILDINMPWVTSLDVLTQIRQSKRHAALPVVILTGDADPKVVTKAISLRADDYIRKDDDATTIRDRLSEHLQTGSLIDSHVRR